MQISLTFWMRELTTIKFCEMLKQVKKKQTNKLLRLLYGVVVIVGLFAAYSLGMQGKNGDKSLLTPDTSTNLTNSTSPICKRYGPVERDEYLTVYIVKRGNTLLSIAKTELKDVSRVNEIITMNQEQFPQLSLNSPFLEQGWKLYLPPKNITNSNGYIFALRGNVHLDTLSNGQQIWGVSERTGGGGSFSLEEWKKYSGSKEFLEGSCVTVIYQGGPGSDHKVLSILFQ